MKEFYHKIIITNLPSFYKINLYNEINRHCRVLVVYTNDGAQGRNNDFFKGEAQFDYVDLKSNKFVRIFQLIKIISKIKHDELILSGWDSLPLWIGAITSPKRKNALVIESSYIESSTEGFKGFIKRRFVGRISKVYASGAAQRKVTDTLGFKGKTIITKGVGVFNYIKQPPYTPRQEVKNFLYVGRLTKVKNLEFLIGKFNNHPELTLTIIGFGELEDSLRSIAKPNIKFLGAIDNDKLHSYYQDADVFILPSLREVWGLVVEEALNNGTPVMVSDRVGCAEEIITPDNGVIFSLDPDNFEQQLSKIRDISTYNRMRQSIATMDFAAIEEYQVKCYL